MIKIIMGHGPVCYIPKVMEIESLVPRDKIFKDFQNVWAWKPSGHVANILIPLTLKFTYKIGQRRPSGFFS